MRKFLSLLSLLLIGNILHLKAQLEVASLFSDHAVLQRDMDIPIWGWAKAGSIVTVQFGETKATANTNSEGYWRVNLPPQAANFDPAQLVIQSEKEKIIFKDMLVGDVWFASGQSNMQWRVDRSNNAEQEIQAANHPNIRLFYVPRMVSRTPKQKVDASWEVCTPESIPDFSAVAYYFGRTLQQSENVPIGLINSSWGGTPSEAWTSLDMLENHPDFKERVKRIYSSKEDFMLAYRTQSENMAAIRKIVQQEEEKDQNTYATLDYKDDAWPNMEVPVHFQNTEISGFYGMAWMRKHFTLTKAQSHKDLQLFLGKIEQIDKTYVNGNEVGSTRQTHKERVYTVPAKLLKEGNNVIAIRIRHFRQFGGGIFSGPLEVNQEGQTLVDLSGPWKYNHKLVHDFPISNKVYHHLPGGLFNGMVAPVLPYAIKGAIWYQGESNANRAWQYRDIFPLMIQDWRINWKQGHFPFLFVQLANFRQTAPEPVDDAWAELREAQSLTLNLPNTGMAVIIDIGEAGDIHPRNKQDVGKRLALAAQKVAYHKELVYSGPTLASSKIEGSKIILTFSHVGKGLMTKDGEELKGFAIAGADGQYHWANAEIIGKDQIAVFHSDLAKPKTVRYAWAINPICNLYNKEGLPASPFRTDDFRGITYGKK